MLEQLHLAVKAPSTKPSTGVPPASIVPIAWFIAPPSPLPDAVPSREPLVFPYIIYCPALVPGLLCVAGWGVRGDDAEQKLFGGTAGDRAGQLHGAVTTWASCTRTVAA